MSEPLHSQPPPGSKHIPAVYCNPIDEIDERVTELIPRLPEPQLRAMFTRLHWLKAKCMDELIKRGGSPVDFL